MVVDKGEVEPTSTVRESWLFYFWEKVSESNNPLKKNGLSISPEQENQEKQEIIDVVELSMLDINRKRADIEELHQQLNLAAKEKNLALASEITSQMDEVLLCISDPELALRVSDNIKTGKDYNELVKAAQNLVNLRDKLLDSALDPGESSAKKKMFKIQFQNQGVTVSVEGHG